MSNRAATTAGFFLGGVVGSLLTWSIAISGERFRRIRRDLKATKKGIKTLRTMLRRNLGDLIRAGLLVALVVGGLIVLVTL